MPTSCLRSRIQLKIAFLCLASICEVFAYIFDIGCGWHLIFFPVGNGFLLWGTKIVSSGANKFQKKSDLWGREEYVREGQIVLATISSGLWQFSALMFLVLRYYPNIPWNSQKWGEAWAVLPLPQLPSPKLPRVLWEAAGNLQVPSCSSPIPPDVPRPFSGASFPC